SALKRQILIAENTFQKPLLISSYPHPNAVKSDSALVVVKGGQYKSGILIDCRDNTIVKARDLNLKDTLSLGGDGRFDLEDTYFVQDSSFLRIKTDFNANGLKIRLNDLARVQVVYQYKRLDRLTLEKIEGNFARFIQNISNRKEANTN